MKTEKPVSTTKTLRKNRKKVEESRKISSDIYNEYLLSEAEADNKFVESLTEMAYEKIVNHFLKKKAKSNEGIWIKKQLRIFILNATYNPKSFLQSIVSNYPNLVLNLVLSDALENTNQKKVCENRK